MNLERMLANAEDLQRIPAPTFHESQRAHQMQQLFRSAGLSTASIDDTGNVIAAGLAWNCINGMWKLGQFDVLFDIMFQHLNPGATKILWYEGYGVTHDGTACSELLAAIRSHGYTVFNAATTPITYDLIADYDVVVIPQLRFGSSYIGGDPNLLPWADDLPRNWCSGS